MMDKALLTLHTLYGHALAGRPVLYVNMEHEHTRRQRVDRSWGLGKTVATIDTALAAQAADGPSRHGVLAAPVTPRLRLADAACMSLTRFPATATPTTGQGE